MIDDMVLVCFFFGKVAKLQTASLRRSNRYIEEPGSKNLKSVLPFLFVNLIIDSIIRTLVFCPTYSEHIAPLLHRTHILMLV